jgi:hypothetical protein
MNACLDRNLSVLVLGLVGEDCELPLLPSRTVDCLLAHGAHVNAVSALKKCHSKALMIVSINVPTAEMFPTVCTTKYDVYI